MGTGPTPRKYPTRLGAVVLQPSLSTLTVPPTRSNTVARAPVQQSLPLALSV